MYEEDMKEFVKLVLYEISFETEWRLGNNSAFTAPPSGGALKIKIY